MKFFLLLCLFFPSLVVSQTLFEIGGSFQADNTETWLRMIEAAGGKENARFACLAPGSDPPELEGNNIANIFRNIYGVNATYIDIRPENDLVDDPATAELISSMTGVFLSGGDKLLIMYTLIRNGRDTLVMSAIRQLIRDGGVFAGTSAGSESQTGSVVLVNGESWTGLVQGAFYQTGIATVFPTNVLSYDPTGGLDIFRGYVADGHFSERGREARLIRVTQQTRNEPTGVTRAFAVDEDVALIITGLYSSKPMGEVIGFGLGGVGGVTVTNVERVIENPSNTTDYENISQTFLTLGDTIDLASGEITFASWKTDLRGNEALENAIPSEDIFSKLSPSRWRDAARDLMNNKNDDVINNYSSEKNPEFEVVFDRRSAVRYGGVRPGGPDSFFLSYRNMTVHIRPSNR